MVYVPHRGNAPVRHGVGVPVIPDIGPSTVDASVYLDPQRFQLERHKVLNRSWQIICRSSQLPNAGDYLVWEGHGETIIVNRRRDGSVGGFHNACRHRGARIARPGCGTARRFTCRWHSWVYDLEGNVIGVPDREDFDADQLDGLRAAPVECDEWGGWVWAVLGGPGFAPALLDWIGPEIVADLGVYRMQDMVLTDTLTWDLDCNWKIVIDGFNENYHAAHLHTISKQDIIDGRTGTFFTFERNAMMVMPFKGVLPELIRTRDHQSTAICHYTIFPTAVFNNNPNHIQLFRAIPIAVDRTRFETWELQYPDGDATYREGVDQHWERLKKVVQEDVEIFQEWAAARMSSAHQYNILNDHECKITFFHRTIQDMLDA
jgi:phenylpropionate dioxygenase-like ring-hydroxylating dioxygenase large terminal subunit